MKTAQKLVGNKEQEQHARSFGLGAELNPLKNQKMTRHFSGAVSQANSKYTATFDERKRLLELEELFAKFDFDGSGTLDLDELVSMFQMAGLKVPSRKLKEMFLLAKNVQIVNNELDCEQFQRLMMSPELEKAFRQLLTEIRRRFKYNDYSMVDPEIGFLPTDLSLMLGYLYKHSIRQNIKDSIKSHLLDSTEQMQPSELLSRVVEDIDRFTALFNLHDDASFDQELRQKYRVGPQERKFREDQHPQKRKDMDRMRLVTDYFLKEIRERSKGYEGLGAQELLDQIKAMKPVKREMKMEATQDKVEISIENLHRIREERRALEEQKAQESGNFDGIIRALTLMKSNSALLEDPISFNKTDSLTEAPVDLKNIKNKEERGLYELLQNLNDNLEMLDNLKDMFDKQDKGLVDLKNLSKVEVDSDVMSYNEARRIVEGIPSPKRVQKGRAVFIVPEKPQEEDPEKKKADRNAKIAQMMRDKTESQEFDFQGALDSRSHSGKFDQSYGSNTNLRAGADSSLSGKPPVHRNASTMLHRSQISQGLHSSFNSVILDGNTLTVKGGKSVMNKKSRYENPFKEQLHLDSRDLMQELLKKNDEHKLSDFQAQTLKNLRNQQLRSKMIIYGDCVDQFELMVEKRHKLYSSMQGFKKVNIGGHSADPDRKQSRLRHLQRAKQQQMERSKDSHNDSPVYINVNDSIDKAPQKRLNINLKPHQATPKHHSDSLFSLSLNETGLESKVSSTNQAGNQDLEAELPSLRQSSLSALTPSKGGAAALKGLSCVAAGKRQKNLLLMSQKVKIFASPPGKRDRHFKKQKAATSNTHHHASSEIRTQDTEENTIPVPPKSKDQQTTTSQTALPFIQSSVVRGGGVRSREFVHISDKSDSTIQKAYDEQVQALGLAMAGDLYENEPEIEHRSSQLLAADFSRNLASTQVMSKNSSSTTAMLLAKNGVEKRPKWRPTKEPTEPIDYNYGGYVSKLADKSAKLKQESFFSSMEKSATQIHTPSDATAFTKSQSTILKRLNAVAKRSKANQLSTKTVNKKDSPQHRRGLGQDNGRVSTFHENSITVKGGHTLESGDDALVTESFQMKPKNFFTQGSPLASSNEKKHVVPTAVSIPPTLQVNETALIDDPRISTRHKSTTKGKKSKSKKRSPAQSSPRNISSNSSLSKIHIVPPQVMIDFPHQLKFNALEKKSKRKAQVAAEPSVQATPSLMGQIAFPSLGASSLNRFSEVSSVQAGGFPSLAAAQARSMTRKQGIIQGSKLTHVATLQTLKKDQSQAQVAAIGGIAGVFGDSIQQMSQDDMILSLKEQAQLKLRHRSRKDQSKKTHGEEQESAAIEAASPSLATDLSHRQQLYQLKATYAGVAEPVIKVDEHVSAQKSLMDSHSYDMQQPAHESLVSSSSGRAAPHSTHEMMERPAIYSGEIQSRKNLPSSTLNVLEAARNDAYLVNQQDYAYPQSLEHLKSMNHPQMAKQFSNQVPMTKQTNLEKSYFSNPNDTHSTFKSVQTNLKSNESPSKAANSHDTGFNRASESPISRSNQNKKEATPFQKFQERMKKLEVTSKSNSPSQAYHNEESIKTPMFRHAAARKRTTDYMAVNTHTQQSRAMISQQANPTSQQTRQSTKPTQNQAQGGYINMSSSGLNKSAALYGNMNHFFGSKGGATKTAGGHESGVGMPITRDTGQSSMNSSGQKIKERSVSQQAATENATAYGTRKAEDSVKKQMSEQKRQSESEVAQTVQGSNMLQVSKLSFTANAAQGTSIDRKRKRSTVVQPVLQNPSLKSLGQTDLIELTSNSRSIVHSQENITGSKVTISRQVLNADLPTRNLAEEQSRTADEKLLVGSGTDFNTKYQGHDESHKSGTLRGELASSPGQIDLPEYKDKPKLFPTSQYAHRLQSISKQNTPSRATLLNSPSKLREQTNSAEHRQTRQGPQDRI